MPTTYAHYRFGAEMLQTMPADVRRTAKRHRQLYDVGLQGPDLFFFYRPVFPGKIRRLGRKFHMQTGKEFFTRVCRSLRLEPNEGGVAYLYGVLCHYSLDAHCHPLVAQATQEDSASHMEIERAFDRFLMERDGIRSAAELGLAERLLLPGGECGVVSRFYNGTDKSVIRASLRSMAKIHRLLEMPEAPMAKVMAAGSETFREMMTAQTECTRWNQPLWEKYQQAAEMFPDMLLRLTAHLTYNASLGEEFDPIFG